VAEEGDRVPICRTKQQRQHEETTDE
jgi:hypothetical protein